MKFKNNIEFTYMDYLHSSWYANDVTDDLEIFNMLQNYKQLAAHSPSILPVFFVIDYSRQQYLFFSESIKLLLGYDARQILEGGMLHTREILQKDYFNTFNKFVFPSILGVLRESEAEERLNYIFSFNYQMKNRNGQYIDILQKTSYITSPETGMPLFGLNMAFDITGFKNNKTLVQTIERVNPHNNTRQLIANNIYFPFEEDNILSSQEIRVLKWLADGLSSKQIAEKLHLSETTIISHRKNMMIKTNTKNVAELISYAYRNHII